MFSFVSVIIYAYIIICNLFKFYALNPVQSVNEMTEVEYFRKYKFIYLCIRTYTYISYIKFEFARSTFYLESTTAYTYIWTTT